MKRRLRFFLLFILVAGCVEPYDFTVKDGSPALVMEAYLSDKSYNETLTYPSDWRYFTVRLSETGDAKPVTGALATLFSSEGQKSIYSEAADGRYLLLDKTFKASGGVEYKLQVALADADVLESGWEAMPDAEIAPMGDIGFQESEKQLYVIESNEWVLRTDKVAAATVQIPRNVSGEKVYYRWTFSPMWIYVAPLISQTSPV